MKTNNQIRLENLTTLVKEAGTQEKLATAAGISRIYLNQLLKQGPAHSTGKARNIGDSTARKLEIAMKKEFGWLDQDHEIQNDLTAGYIYLDYYDIHSSAGPGSVVTYEPKVKQLLVLEDWATEYLGRHANRHIKVINNKGVSMHPTINDGDVLLVDVTINHYDGDGIYVINVDGDLLTKRLIKDTDGSLRVVSDNTSIGYKDKIIDSKNKDSLVLCGKVKRYFSLREPV